MVSKAPIYFYYPNPIPENIDFKSGLDCWILKTYQILKKATSELTIHLVDTVPDSGIVIFHKGFFPSAIVPNASQLFVCVQADYGRYRFAQCHIAQNPYGVSNVRFSRRSFFEENLFSFSKNFFIPHWNQESIIKRNVERKNEFQNVCFYGVPQNFPKELAGPNFKEKLKSEGIELHIITDSEKWNDYSETDCVLAIRDFSGKPHYNKPFSKIINAYAAGVPVISAKESSAIFLKNEKGLQFPIVNSAEECFNEILNLRDDYEKKIQLVLEKNKTLAIFHDEQIVLDWIAFLMNIQLVYLDWQRSPRYIKKLFYTIRKA